MAFEVRERTGGMFEHCEAHAGTVLEPAEDNEQQIVDLAGCSEVTDEEGYLPRALFDVEVAEVEASEERAEEYEFAREVAAEVNFGEDNGDHWSLDRFEVGEAEVADGERVADTLEKHRKVVHPGVVWFAGA